MILQEPFKTSILHCLNHFAYADAIFLAERLFAEVGSNDALYLLATAYYQSGKPKVAAVLLDNHNTSTPQCKLLHAQCYWDLKIYSKVEQILTCGYTNKGMYLFKPKCHIATVITDIQREFGESACYVLSLLGKTYLKTERYKLAEQCLLAGLKLNPLLWVSFRKLCEAGHRPDPQKIFGSHSALNMSIWKWHANPDRTASQPATHAIQNRSLNVRDSEPESNILRTRQLHNRPNQSQQVPSSNVLSNKQAQINVEKSQPSPCMVNPIVLQLNYDNMLTPPNVKQDALGDSLNPLPSSVCSQKDTSVTTPGHQVFRSTPSDDQFTEWNSTIAYSNSAVQPSKQKTTMTQRKINRVISSPSTLSPISPRFGMAPLADTPSPVGERVGSMVTPVDVIQQPDVAAPVKKMVTRQSRKLNSGHHGTNPAFGKLHFSSENTSRCLTTGIANNAKALAKSSSNNQAVPARRSTRSFPNAGSAIKENNRNAAKVKHGQSTKRNSKSRSNQGKVDDASLCADIMCPADSQLNAHNWDVFDGILKVMRLVGESYLALCQYNCRGALSHLSNVPLNHRKSGWVLSIIAKAHFELNEYVEAVTVFKELRSIAPHDTFGLEIYSTALWHLHRDVELSNLAHDLQELDRLCPETWCAVGNCFSLQRDHASAASFFRRAIQLDPEFSYAYALLGHEKALIEDFEGALTCYRNALRWNSRLYNAWYGIGTIYYKQEKYKNAELHFRKSLEINPHNSVLLCHIGIVQHALQLTSAACDTLQAAVEMSPRNPLCKFHHANVLIAMERYEEAAHELRELKEIVPKESLVYFLLGKVYKKLKQNHLAVICFSWALDLDPKGANNQIKEAINRQHLMNDDNDVDAETSGFDTDLSHLVSSDIMGGDHVLTHEGFLNRSSRIDEPNGDSDSDSL